MPAEVPIPASPEFQEAFQEAERQVRINTGRLACALVVVLMPLGLLMDFALYHDHHSHDYVGEFLLYRILCSLLVIGVWLLHSTPLARRHYPVVGLPIVILPALFMTWMIYRTEGPTSPYYAALNLILLAVSAVGHWSFRETTAAVVAVIGMYSVAMLLYPIPAGQTSSQTRVYYSLFINNIYFLSLTGVIVVAGNTVFNRLRSREFSLRFELDRNRRQLEESNQKLLELDQAKSHFFANISHELRTPLTLLLAPIESLMSRPDIAADPATYETLQTMEANGLRLLRLINDLLDLVRLESGRMEVRNEQIDLPRFLRGLASTVRPVAVNKQIRLETEVPDDLGTAVLDRDKLEKILLNLLFNALKFTPASGSVRLEASHADGELILKVVDNGIGIAAHQLPSVFSRFWQADTSSHRKHPGAGIGLALVKELAEVQGGSVGVASVEGHGSTFTVRLPWNIDVPQNTTPPEPIPTPAATGAQSEAWLANLYRRAELFPTLSVRETAPSPQPATNAEVPTDRCAVLVADDEPDMLRFLQSQLARQYHVVEASDGEQAVRLAAQCQPDLVLLDMMMPVKDGLQACREIREAPATRHTPIVLLTARADEATKLASLSAGASDFLTKPFSTTELEVRVRNLVSNHQLQKELASKNRLLESTIDQLKETEVQLIQAEKLASLGRLSAGIIHEINNPLNFAATSLYSLRQHESRLPDGLRPEFADILSDLDEGLRRVRLIVSDLRSFTHTGGGPHERVELAGVAEVALRFLSHERRENLRFEVELTEGLAVRADRNRLLQVIVNLLQNSVDALKAKTFQHEAPVVQLRGRAEPGLVLLTVRDNGIGIPPELLDKIFDPFFTTKDVGQGLGLGLTISYRILQDFGARIQVRSEAGRFTEMNMVFPDHPPVA